MLALKTLGSFAQVVLNVPIIVAVVANVVGTEYEVVLVVGGVVMRVIDVLEVDMLELKEVLGRVVKVGVVGSPVVEMEVVMKVKELVVEETIVVVNRCIK